MHDAEKNVALLVSGAVNVYSEQELLKNIKSGKRLKIKLGADPTAPDLHLGHAVVLSKLKQFQDLGSVRKIVWPRGIEGSDLSCSAEPVRNVHTIQNII